MAEQGTHKPLVGRSNRPVATHFVLSVRSRYTHKTGEPAHWGGASLFLCSSPAGVTIFPSQLVERFDLPPHTTQRTAMHPPTNHNNLDLTDRITRQAASKFDIHSKLQYTVYM